MQEQKVDGQVYPCWESASLPCNLGRANMPQGRFSTRLIQAERSLELFPFPFQVILD